MCDCPFASQDALVDTSVFALTAIDDTDAVVSEEGAAASIDLSVLDDSIAIATEIAEPVVVTTACEVDCEVDSADITL